MKIKFGFFPVLIVLSLFITDWVFALSALLAVTIHEMGHILAAKALNVSFNECKIGIYGAGLTPSNFNFSYKKEIFISMAGPLSNALSVVVVLPFYNYFGYNFVMMFMFSSFILGCLNILPIRTFDGGRILYSVISTVLSESVAETLLNLTSSILIFIMWSVSVYMLITLTAGLSCFIFSISLDIQFLECYNGIA